MVDVSARDRTTFTSSPPHRSDVDFRLRIKTEENEENVGDFGVIQVEARVLGEAEVGSIDRESLLGEPAFKYADEATVGEELIVTHVSRMGDVPVCQYMPADPPSRIDLPFCVSRGPEHPEHSIAAKIELTATGYATRDDADRDDAIGYELGSAQIVVEG